MYTKTKQIREERRKAAEKIQAERNTRSDKEQLAKLDKTLGKGKGAKRERARLKERNAPAKPKPEAPKPEATP